MRVDDVLYMCVLCAQVVTVTSTTTTGKELNAENLAKVQEACDMALALDTDKRLVGHPHAAHTPGQH